MKPLLSYTHFYLVGIKGVAMTSLAQCLLDAGKTVTGSDVAEDFVTKPLLDGHGISVDIGFDHPIPDDVDCVIYTSAHKSYQNPQVQAAVNLGITVLTQAKAVAGLFNDKQGIAVCGVGGKSTTSAMLTWMLWKLGNNPSFSVGVGNIPGLNKTGAWSEESHYFVAEADEYVTDPSAPSRGEAITPRFSFLKPKITVCTNLRYDHPDVYTSFEHTLETYNTFFKQIKENGTLVVTEQVKEHITLEVQKKVNLLVVGTLSESQCYYQEQNFRSEEGLSSLPVTFTVQGKTEECIVKLQLPGLFNMVNALQAITVMTQLGFSAQEAANALSDFRSTKRRSEFIGEKNGVKFYDDYAHHPSELSSVIKAFKDWYPHSKLVVAFQPHTFSRTKALFTEFSQAFSAADEVVMIDIFASAREPYDSSITSTMLCEAINAQQPGLNATNYGTLQSLSEHLKTSLKEGDVCLTVGAGDIYHLHELL